MTAATYTFTLSTAQSSTATMNVAMRAKTGSSIPGTAARWQGGVMPTATLTWAAGVTTATTTVNTAPNSAVDGNAEYEWYKVSSTPSDLTLNTAALPTITITDDDTGGGGGTAPTFTRVYGYTDSAADVTTQFVESIRQQCGRTWKSSAPKWKATMGRTADGNAATGLRITIDDAAGSLTYQPFINNALANPVRTVVFSGNLPSNAEKYTFLKLMDNLDIVYGVSTEQDPNNQTSTNTRILAVIDKSVWYDLTFWTDQSIADRVPGKYLLPDAHEARADGLYAGRFGPAQ